ncbi:MAG TPA: lysophospholipid acyltransferase family protein [Pyrinomonadaceae bacterium]|nr:lysophospholipid acyltransferase family protein [Pyrinomonadaceae bacterium]
MPDDEVRVLSLGDMLLRRKGTGVQRVLHALISVALRLFFRRIETSRASLVPTEGPLVFVLNHPNGAIDPALVFAALPRRISFLAKSTVFSLPVVGSVLRAFETLPLYRRVDAGADVARNQLTFAACRELLRRGRCIALFPEGVSHNSPKLLPVKTGAARIALGAISVGSTNDNPSGGEAAESALPLELKIVPVGLYYTSKTSFRSEALMRFGEPLRVRPVELDEEGEPPREAVRELSARIEAALRKVTLNTETEEQLGVVQKAERLLSSIYEGINVELPLAARFDSLRRLAAGRWTEWLSAGGGVEDLRRRVTSYEEELRRIGLTPENLSLSRHSRWYVFRHFLLRTALLLVLAPLAVPGALLHLPAYLLCTLAARLFPKHGVDEIAPTVKIVTAIALMPLTWLIVSALAFYFWGWRAALFAFPLSILCGYVALRSFEELHDMRGWFRAVLLLLRRRRLFLRLLIERRALRNELSRVGDGGDERG